MSANIAGRQVIKFAFPLRTGNLTIVKRLCHRCEFLESETGHVRRYQKVLLIGI